jgi:hypothetical protein
VNQDIDLSITTQPTSGMRDPVGPHRSQLVVSDLDLKAHSRQVGNDIDTRQIFIPGGERGPCGGRGELRFGKLSVSMKSRQRPLGISSSYPGSPWSHHSRNSGKREVAKQAEKVRFSQSSGSIVDHDPRGIASGGNEIIDERDRQPPLRAA